MAKRDAKPRSRPHQERARTTDDGPAADSSQKHLRSPNFQACSGRAVIKLLQWCVACSVLSCSAVGSGLCRCQCQDHPTMALFHPRLSKSESFQCDPSYLAASRQSPSEHWLFRPNARCKRQIAIETFAAPWLEQYNLSHNLADVDRNYQTGTVLNIDILFTRELGTQARSIWQCLQMR
jgi:hypothetical protein